METGKYGFTDETSATLKDTSGVLFGVIVGETSASAVKIWDGTGSGGTQIGELKASIAEGDYEFGCRFAKGLYVENPGRSKLTFIYR